MALLSIYVLVLLGLAIFTMWRVSRKQPSLACTTRIDAVLQFSGETEDVRKTKWQQKGIANSRADGSGGASGSGSGGILFNTHLSHENLVDTEQTALLGGDGYKNAGYGTSESREAESYDEERQPIEPRQSERSGGKEEPNKGMVPGKMRSGIGNQSLRELAPEEQGEGSNLNVLDGLWRVAQETR